MKRSALLSLAVVVWCAVGDVRSIDFQKKKKLQAMLTHDFWKGHGNVKIRDSTLDNAIKDGIANCSHLVLDDDRLTATLRAVRTFVGCEFCDHMRRWSVGLDSLTARTVVDHMRKMGAPYKNYVDNWTNQVRPLVKEAGGALASWSKVFQALIDEIPSRRDEQDEATLNMAQTLDRFANGQDEYQWGTCDGQKYSRLTLMQATVRDAVDRYAEDYCQWPDSKWNLPDNAKGPVEYAVEAEVAKATVSEAAVQLHEFYDKLPLAKWLDLQDDGARPPPPTTVAVAVPDPSKFLDTHTDVKWMWKGVMRSVDDVYAETAHGYRADLLEEYLFLAQHTVTATFLVYLSDFLAFYSKSQMNGRTDRFAVHYTRDPLHLKHVRSMVNNFSANEQSSTNRGDTFLMRLRDRIEQHYNGRCTLTVANMQLIITHQLTALDAFLKITIKNNADDWPTETDTIKYKQIIENKIYAKRKSMVSYYTQVYGHTKMNEGLP